MAAPTTASNVTKSIAQTAQYIQEVWTREIAQPFDKKLQIAKLVQDRSGLVAGGGDILRVPFVAAVDARAKSASTQLTFDSPDGTAISFNIDKHYYVGVLIEDIAKVQSNYDLKAAFFERMTESLARQIDADLMGLYASVGSTVAGGAAVDDADMIALVTAFDATYTPTTGGGIRGVIGNNTKADLLGVNKYTAYDQTGKIGKAVDGTDGLVGSVYGMDLYHSNTVVVDTTGRNLFFHKLALSKAVQQAPKMETEYSVRDLGWLTALHTIYGVGVERAGSFIALTRTSAA